MMEGCRTMMLQRDNVKCGDFYYGTIALCYECREEAKKEEELKNKKAPEKS